MPGKRSKRNPDPSRGVVFDDTGGDIRVAGRCGRAGLRGSVDGVCWLAGVAGAGRHRGRSRRNSGVRDHSASRCRRSPGTVDGHSFVAGELLGRGHPPCVVAGGAFWTTALVSWQVRTSVCLVSNLQRCAERKNPAALTAGFFPCSRLMTRYFVLLPPRRRLMIDDRTDDRACGADDVVLPAGVQKTTFLDDR
jgi:hypothetical protein